VSDTRPPSVDSLAGSLTQSGLPHPLLVDAAREAIAAGDPSSALRRAEARARTQLRPVVNATGVLLHTNLGRAPVAHSQLAEAQNLELSLATGKRGSRQATVGPLLAKACQAEAAIVVNNCAAAVLLALAALASGRAVSVSRGELVEIGGGFRVPDVLAQSGAELVEVGTTNRTRLADFSGAAAKHDIAVALQVHQSNYRITGFTEAVSVSQLSTLDAPVVVDIGSGLLDAACPWLDGPPPTWLSGEPAAKQTLQAGAALVIFSGDKLLGGPQAGIIAGKAELVKRCESHPLARALRPGGLVLGSLQQTVLSYLKRDGQAIPFWKMASADPQDIQRRANSIAAKLADGVEVVETKAVPGGGTLPSITIPSFGLRLPGDHLEALRSGEPPIIGRIEDGCTYLDLRSVDPGNDQLVLSALLRLSTDGSQADPAGPTTP